MAQQKFEIAYLRLNRDDALQGESNRISNQREMLLRYAKEHGFNNVKVVADDGFSGSTFSRPGWQELMVLVENDEVSVIMLKSMERMGRDYLRVGLFMMEEFSERGIRLIVVNDSVDTLNGVDDFTPFRNIMAEWYARDISNKIKTSMHTKELAGKHLTGFTVYGYKTDPNEKIKWIVDEEATEVVRKIYRLCLAGHDPNQIETILNNCGIDSPMVHQRKNGINNRGKNNFWGTEW
jgi:DNA invertase Pin-like site-specific DNA recombinase